MKLNCETLRVFRVFLTAMVFGGPVLGVSREFVEHDNVTSIPDSAYPSSAPAQSTNAPVVSSQLEIGFAEPAESIAQTITPVPLYPFCEIVVESVFPAGFAKVVEFDRELFWFWPVAHEASVSRNLHVPVITEAAFAEMERIYVETKSIPAAIASVVGHFDSFRIEPVEFHGVPMLSVLPISGIEWNSTPTAVAFPIAGNSGTPAMCVVYKTEDGYKCVAIVVSDLNPIEFASKGSRLVPDVFPITAAQKQNRFLKYGRYPYPTIMWRLQEMGDAAEKRGDTISADAIYADFLRAFNDFSMRYTED